MSRVVSFRAEDPLYARLREFAQRSSLSEGQAALFLVDVGLGKDPRSAAISTYMRAFSARLKSPVREAVRRISADLERFARTFGGDETFTRVEPPEEEEEFQETVDEPQEYEDPPTAEARGESGDFDREPESAEEQGESGAFDREPSVETQGLGGGRKRRRGKRGGKR